MKTALAPILAAVAFVAVGVLIGRAGLDANAAPARANATSPELRELQRITRELQALNRSVGTSGSGTVRSNIEQMNRKLGFGHTTGGLESLLEEICESLSPNPLSAC